MVPRRPNADASGPEHEPERQVAVRTDKAGQGSLAIDFGSLEQLQAALRQLEDLIGRLRQTAGPRAKEAATNEG